MKPPLTHNHLARPLVTASHDIEALGEVHRCPLVRTDTNHLDLLSGNRIDVKRGVTVASDKDDTPLGTLRNRSLHSRFNALWQEIVGNRDGIHRADCQHAGQYVEHSLHSLLVSVSDGKITTFHTIVKHFARFFLSFRLYFNLKVASAVLAFNKN